VRLVIKIGGALLEDPALVQKWAHCVSQLAASGHEVMAVHGGGAALTRTLERLGKKSTFLNGLRVTDAETRDAALMVLAGLTNKKLVAALARHGTRAVGLCGADGLSFRARKRPSPNGDLGFVGDISSVDAEWLEKLRSQGTVPVIASIALGEDGEFYNVNADEMASACAVACKAALLAFLTDVPGVWDAERQVIPRLTSSQIADLTRSGVIHGGMLPKLEACQRALRGGVSSVHILPGAALEQLSLLGRTPIGSGTELVA
jgi:acetylglutamate kinase